MKKTNSSGQGNEKDNNAKNGKTLRKGTSKTNVEVCTVSYESLDTNQEEQNG